MANHSITYKTKIVYGSIFLTFLLLISSCSGGVKDKDGNIYKTVKIGTQVWMAENLSVSHFKNGDSIPEAQSYEEWRKLGGMGKPAWCIVQNDPANGIKYGKLYNWFAVNDPRGLAPAGWHIASDHEWTKLTDFLGGGVLAAMNMRTVGLTEADKGSSQSGFSGLPGGNRNAFGMFYGLYSFGYWWSATELNASDSWMRQLNCVRCDINSLTFNKQYGLSVRCVQD